MKILKNRFLIFLSFILSVSLTSCAISTGDGDANSKVEVPRLIVEDDVMDKGPERGGTLRLFSTKPDTLNPILTNNVYVHEFLQLVFEGMVAVGEDQKAVPALADKWEVSEDGLVWTFHIRDNAVWQNGMPVTADDVKFTIETIQNSSVTSYYKKNVENFALFTAVDKQNFRVYLKDPNSFTPELMTFPILPKYYYTGDDITKKTSKTNMEPIGTGLYKFADFDNTNIIRFIRNDKWWGKGKDGENLPYIDEINLKIYPAADDEFNAFQVGDVDIATISINDFTHFNGRQDVNLKRYIGKNYDFVAFNLNKPVLADKSVRQAIAYGIDKGRIINDLLPGQAVVAEIPVAPNSWIFDPNIPSYKYDKTMAKDVLSQGGWKDYNGRLYKSINGVRRYLDLELIVNEQNDIRCKIAEKISSQLKEVGINVTVKKVNWDEQLKLIQSKRYDLALVGYKVTSIPDISFAYSTVESSGDWNISGYKNSSLDLYLKQILSQSDMEKKRALFSVARQIISDEVPYVGLCFYNNAMLFSKRIRGNLTPNVWDKYSGISKWYVAKEK